MRYLPEEIEYIYKMHQSKTWPANTLYKAVESCPNSIRRHPIWYINRGYIVRITQYPKSVYRLTQRVVRQCETNIILATDPSYLVKNARTRIFLYCVIGHTGYISPDYQTHHDKRKRKRNCFYRMLICDFSTYNIYHMSTNMES